MFVLDPDALRAAAGLGVAGNFAGHLEQAGEAEDFVGVAGEQDAPKGIFPWYIPGRAGQLGTFPVSADRLTLPGTDVGGDLQIEPEAGLWCALTYDAAGAVKAIEPLGLVALNDCSIRRPGARKISEKKNWSAASKGAAATGFAVTSLTDAAVLGRLRLACFLRRDGVVSEYGIDSPVLGYSYFGDRLLTWLVERLGAQEGADGSPLEPVGAYLHDAGCPACALIGVGATRYTELGETTFLRAGDDAIVVLYDGAQLTNTQIAEAAGLGTERHLQGASVLVQRAVA